MRWLLFALLAQYQPPRAGTTLADPQQEARAERIGKTIRCAVCQGLSVADSPAPMAQAMMDRIRDQVKEGKSDDEVRVFFEQRYGEFILLSPKAEGLNLIVWIGPVGVALLGLYLIASARPNKSGSAQAAPAPTSTAPASAGAVDDAYLALVKQEVDE